LTLLYISAFIAPSLLVPYNIDIAEKVFLSIETDSDPLSVNGSIFSNNIYTEKERTPEPDDSEA